MVAKIADPGARIRYASMYGAALVELHKYKEALGPLDEAIRVAAKTRGAAYPSIAIDAKIEALSGLGRNQEALALAAQEMQKMSAYHLAGHLYQLYQTRAGIYERMGQWDQAVLDMEQAVQYTKQLSYWRGLTQVDGTLAEAYVHQGAFQSALSAINEAIEAHKNIPDELYFVPRNLGIKAEILSRMGDVKASNDLFEKSADLLDALLSKVPTPMVERELLSDLSVVYAGYFTSLCDQGRMTEAFQAIERACGRVEAQALSHHEVIAPHQPTMAELALTSLNLKLLNTDDPLRYTNNLAGTNYRAGHPAPQHCQTALQMRARGTGDQRHLRRICRKGIQAMYNFIRAFRQFTAGGVKVTDHDFRIRFELPNISQVAARNAAKTDDTNPHLRSHPETLPMEYRSQSTGCDGFPGEWRESAHRQEE